MKAGLKLKALAAVLALGAAGSAFADMTLDGASSGSVILNVYDTVSGTSFIYDTGLTTATFTGTSNYSASLTSDVNYQAFVTAAGSDALYYQVMGNEKTNAVGEKALTTASSFNLAAKDSGVQSALTFGQGYYGAVSILPSATTNSAYESVASDPAGFASFNSSWNGNLSLNDLGAVGSSLNFYGLTVNSGGTRSATAADLTTYGTWNLVNGALTYTSTVPTPASWGLLLSGLALMGVIARRKKSTANEDFFGAAA